MKTINRRVTLASWLFLVFAAVVLFASACTPGTRSGRQVAAPPNSDHVAANQDQAAGTATGTAAASTAELSNTKALKPLPAGWQYYAAEHGAYELVNTKLPYRNDASGSSFGCQGVGPTDPDHPSMDSIAWCEAVSWDYLKQSCRAVDQGEVPKAWRDALLAKMKPAEGSTGVEPRSKNPEAALTAAGYRQVLRKLKATRNPAVSNAYQIVAGAPPSSSSSSTYSPSGSSSSSPTYTPSYSSSSREPTVDEINIARRYGSLQDKLQQGDSRGALWDAGVMLEHAKNTGDPDKIRAAQKIHDALYQRAGGYGIGSY